MAKIAFADKPREGSGHTLQVPAEIAEDMETAWKFLSENPDKEGFAEEDTKEALNKYIRLARVYLAGRDGGPVILRKLPSKHLADNQCRFTLTAGTDAEEHNETAGGE